MFLQPLFFPIFVTGRGVYLSNYELFVQYFLNNDCVRAQLEFSIIAKDSQVIISPELLWRWSCFVSHLRRLRQQITVFQQQAGLIKWEGIFGSHFFFFFLRFINCILDINKCQKTKYSIVWYWRCLGNENSTVHSTLPTLTLSFTIFKSLYYCGQLSFY